MIRLAIALVAFALGVAHADEDAADRAFRAAQALAAAGDPAALDAFEALGTARPLTRWTDDAWAEAARLAEARRDYARARRALDEVITVGSDPRLVARAKATRDRLAAATGAGEWDAVARRHEELVAAIFGGDDPRDELAALATLVTEHPAYPRANAARLAIARGWEQEGHGSRALAAYRDAASHDPSGPAHLELARALIRAGDLDDAAHELDALARSDRLDASDVSRARDALAQAERRRWIRRALVALLVVLVATALHAVRRGGSLRRLARPPGEVLFLAPVVALVTIVAYQGNPLVARAVRDIGLGGLTVAWLSGHIASRTWRARLVHVVLAVAAAADVAYLAIDRDRLLDLVGETWRSGPGYR